MNRATIAVMLITVAPTVFAQKTNTLDALRQAHDSQQRSILAHYGDALNAIMADVKKKGDLDSVLILQAEQKRFEEEKTVPAPAETKVSFRAASEAYYQSMLALLRQYVRALDALIKQEVAADRIEDAKVVRAEKDKASFMLADMQIKLPAPARRAAESVPSAGEAGRGMTLELGKGTTMEFVPIPAGSFMMGSNKGDPNEKSVHKVTITKPFLMSKYEVTQEQWEQVMGSNPSSFKGARNPVEMVSWNDCQSFLSKIREKANGMDIRLPTEAEWEYACRAGSKTEYCYGDEDDKIGQYAWFSGNSGSATHPVGRKKPNAWGLYDMYGNVLEWCSDFLGSYEAAPETDPVGPPSGPGRVVRGGSWLNDAETCRSAFHNYGGADHRINYVGLRVVAAGR